MELKYDDVAVTKQYLTIGMVADYGGPIRFCYVKVPIEDLVDTCLYGYLGVAAQRRADREHRDWCEAQDMLFD